MARVGISPNAVTSISIVGFWGPEEPGDDTANRYGAEALLWRKLGKVQAWVQGDYGREQANAALPDPTQDAKWWALGGWVSYDFASTLGLALRGDYVDDQNGARSTFNGLVGFPANTGQKFGGAAVCIFLLPYDSASYGRPHRRGDLGVRYPAACGRYPGRASSGTVGLARPAQRRDRPPLYAGPAQGGHDRRRRPSRRGERAVRVRPERRGGRRVRPEHRPRGQRRPQARRESPISIGRRDSRLRHRHLLLPPAAPRLGARYLHDGDAGPAAARRPHRRHAVLHGVG